VNLVRKVLLLFFVLALVGSACSSGSKTVATVNGYEISLSDVQALAPSEGTVDTATFDGNLRNLIIEKAVEQAAEQEWGLGIDQNAVDTKYNDLLASIGSDDATIDAYLTSNSITRDTIRHVAIQQLLGAAIDDKLSAQVTEPTEEELQAAYDANKDAKTTVCVRHILVDTEEEANTVIDRLNNGESFADVAAEVSTDTASGQNGGDLGCAAPSSYVPEFAAATLTAPIGEVYGPVQTQYGYHVLIVDSREVPTFDDMRADLITQLKSDQSSQLFSDWIMSKLDAATIDVDQKYGTWAGSPDYKINPPA